MRNQCIEQSAIYTLFYLWVLPKMGLWAQYSCSGYPRIQF